MPIFLPLLSPSQHAPICHWASLQITWTDRRRPGSLLGATTLEPYTSSNKVLPITFFGVVPVTHRTLSKSSIYFPLTTLSLLFNPLGMILFFTPTCPFGLVMFYWSVAILNLQFITKLSKFLSSELKVIFTGHSEFHIDIWFWILKFWLLVNQGLTLEALLRSILRSSRWRQ